MGEEFVHMLANGWGGANRANTSGKKSTAGSPKATCLGQNQWEELLAHQRHQCPDLKLPHFKKSSPLPLQGLDRLSRAVPPPLEASVEIPQLTPMAAEGEPVSGVSLTRILLSHVHRHL